MQEKQQYPLFDMAYQGFASGDTERDAASIRIFLEDGHQIAVSQSFAKNMGLYGQRIGCLRWAREHPPLKWRSPNPGFNATAMRNMVLVPTAHGSSQLLT